MNHGRIQLQVLDYLLAHYQETPGGGAAVLVTIEALAGPAASRAKIATVRRAVRSLAAEGLIVVEDTIPPRSPPSGEQATVTHARSVLMVRLARPPSSRSAGRNQPNEPHPE